jgi:hypothetical protein
MKFPLVPSGSLNVSIRERADRLPQPAPECSLPAWAAPNPTILLRTYKPAVNTFFIDSEYLQRFESVEKPDNTTKWGDIIPQTARNFYQKTAARQQLKKHTIDLYV